MKYLYRFAMLLLALAGCQSAEDTPERIAQDICDCMRPLAQSYEGVKAAAGRNDLDALHRYAEEMERLMSKKEEKIEAKYGALEGARGEQVKAAMQQTCPDIVATINEAEAEFIK